MYRTTELFLSQRHGLELKDLGVEPGASGFTGVDRFRVGDTLGAHTVSYIRIWHGFFEVGVSSGARRYYNPSAVVYWSPLVDGALDG
jgi:hypothetical protein